MKHYDLKFSFCLSSVDSNYTTNYAIRCDVSEKLPANVDPQKYLRQRLSEELKRHFDALIEPIDNKTEEAKQEVDALEPSF